MDRILITWNHLEACESIKEHIEQKFGRLLDHYNDIIRVRVDLNLDSGCAAEKRFITRSIIELRGPDIVATSETDNAYASLDTTLQKAERQLRHRSRLARHKRNRLAHRTSRGTFKQAPTVELAYA